MKTQHGIFDIFNLEYLQHLQDLFSEAIGVASIITSAEGALLTQPSNYSQFCKDRIATGSKGCVTCMRKNPVTGIRSSDIPTVEYCPDAGLMNVGISIMLEDKHLANWYIGQVRQKGGDDSKLFQFAQIQNAKEDVDIKNIEELPQMTEKQFMKIAEMLCFQANELSERAYINLKLEREIEQRQITEKILKESEQYLKETQNIARLGSYTLQIAANNWKSSDMLDTIFGIDKEFDKSIEGWLSIIHPDWQQEISEYFQNHVIAQKQRFDKEYKIIRVHDKAERWVRGLGELVYDENENPVSLIGVIRDITDSYLADAALKKSEELYRTVMNTSPDAIIVVDLKGIIQMVSPNAIVYHGAESQDELIGQNMYSFLAQADKERAELNTVKRFEEYLGLVEYKLFNKMGNPYFVEINGDIIWGTDGQPAGMVLAVRDITERKIIDEELKDSKIKLQSFAAHLQKVREEEKNLLATEIHDELSQYLVALKIDLGLLKQNLIKASAEKATDIILNKFEDVLGLVDNTIDTTRKIMSDLRPEILNMVGLVETIRFYTKKFEERYKINCLIQCLDEKLILSDEFSVALFRIFQEALANVSKHAQATQVWINISQQASKLTISIKDNGLGFNQNTIPESFGIIGMRERVLFLGGEIEISSKNNEGTIVTVKIPYL